MRHILLSALLLSFVFSRDCFCQTLNDIDSVAIVIDSTNTNSLNASYVPYMYFIFGSDTPKIQFVGSGEVQKAITQGSELPVNTGIGVTYRKEFNPDTILQKKIRTESTKFRKEEFKEYAKGDLASRPSRLHPLLFELEAVINIASTADTLSVERVNGYIVNRSSFGSGINTPINSRQSAKLAARIYCKDFISILDGYEGSLYINNRSWQINDTTNIGAGALNIKLGFFADVIPNKYLEDYSIRLGVVPFGFKFLIGDITQKSNNVNRTEIIGSNDVFFYSPELNLSLRLKNIEAKFSLPVTITPDANIPGLSGMQFITSISFTGGFPLQLNE